MKKILSVLLASAMLSIPAVSVSADDSDCKIKDVLSNVLEDTYSVDSASCSFGCNILNVFGGVGEICQKLASCENGTSVGIDLNSGLAGYIFDVLKNKLITPDGKVEEIEKPDVPEITIPEVVIPEEDEEMARQVIDIVNINRAQYGLAPVSYREDATCAAQVRAAEIQELFSHTRPDGSDCFTALDECNAVYRGAGENIAMGQSSAQEVMDAWMNSEGHRANILKEDFKYLGVGITKDSNGTYYWTQMFTY